MPDEYLEDALDGVSSEVMVQYLKTLDQIESWPDAANVKSTASDETNKLRYGTSAKELLVACEEGLQLIKSEVGSTNPLYESVAGGFTLRIASLCKKHIILAGDAKDIIPLLNHLFHMDLPMVNQMYLMAAFGEDMKSSSKCYIATMVYGDAECAEVCSLRRFRDQVLSHSWLGRVFIRVYYKCSPAFVRVFSGCTWLHKIIRCCLDRFLKIVN